jgi:two-component system response regulator PilR (NtrC family)
MQDIAPLVEHYAKRLAPPASLPKNFSARALAAFHDHDWRGNLRELELVVEAALRLSKGDRVGTREVRSAIMQLGGQARSRSSQPGRHAARSADVERHDSSLPTVERALIIDTFEAAQRNISEAARRLGIPRSTLRDRLRRLGL